MTTGVARATVFAAILASTTACTSAEQWGFPRTPVSATSPDGTRVAFVRNHPNPDPPSQTIWVGERENGPRRIAELGPDSDWCNTIVWSSDSSTVAFLIQDARLVTVDAVSQHIISQKWLTPWKGEYPPYQMVVDLSLDTTGSAARFRVCERQLTRPGYVHDPTGCGEFQRVALRN